MGNKKFDLIVFDLDGTLFDTEWTILESLNGFIDSEGLRKLSKEEIRSFFGPPVALSFRKYYPDIPESDMESLVNRYRTYYIEHDLLKAKYYEGTEKVLAELKKRGYKLAVASYKLMRCVTVLLENKGATKYFDSIKGSPTELGNTKTNIIKMALEECNVTSGDNVCMIGDTMHDFTGAKNLDMSFIGINYSGNFTTLPEEVKTYEKFIGICNKPNEMLGLIC